MNSDTIDPKYRHITLALAGIMQAAALVREVAQEGKIEESAYETSLSSILKLDAPTVESVYGNVKNLELGLKELQKLFNQSTPPIQTRYMLSMIHLQKKISRSPSALRTLKERILQIQKQVEYFHLTHPTVISNLADLYLHSIKNFKFRIIIWGDQRILKAGDNMEKIRVLLLAGIRSAVLWRQVGGRRFQFIFSRNKIKTAIQHLLQECYKN